MMKLFRNESSVTAEDQRLDRPVKRRAKVLADPAQLAWREAARAEFAIQFSPVLPPALLQRTLLEAEAIAFTTSTPELVFPVLAEEKLTEARRWVERQQDVWDRSAVAFSE
jgi:hypothetical protein